jgi:hypothetical protein
LTQIPGASGTPWQLLKLTGAAFKAYRERFTVAIGKQKAKAFGAGIKAVLSLEGQNDYLGYKGQLETMYRGISLESKPTQTTTRCRAAPHLTSMDEKLRQSEIEIPS